MTAPTLDDILERLRSAGGRVTEPRRAVIGALLAGRDHPTADDLASHIAKSHPTVHKSTVYRTLEALADLGIVGHVHLGHGSAVYHLKGDTDLHLLCDRCAAVAHVSSEVLATTRAAIHEATGFVLEAGHFALPGLCQSCAESSATPS